MLLDRIRKFNKKHSKEYGTVVVTRPFTLDDVANQTRLYKDNIEGGVPVDDYHDDYGYTLTPELKEQLLYKMY